jgi:hypothetical protein
MSPDLDLDLIPDNSFPNDQKENLDLTGPGSAKLVARKIKKIFKKTLFNKLDATTLYYIFCAAIDICDKF